MGCSVQKLSFLAIALVSLAGCFDGPGFLRQSDASKTDKIAAAASTVVDATTLSNEGGVLVASLKAGSTSTQLMKASDGSAIAGATVSFPPGSLAIDTNITMEEGSSLVLEQDAASLGIGSGSNVLNTAAAVVISSSAKVTLSQPMTVQLPLPVGAGLSLTGNELERLVVIFKGQKSDADGGGIIFGIIPRTEIAIENGVAVIKTQLFGSYQTIITKELIAERKELASTTAITTARSTPKPGSFNIKAPSGVTFTSQVNVTWDAASDAQTYDASVTSDAACAKAVVTKAGIVGTTVAVDGLGDGSYFACVTALGTGGRTTAANQGLAFTVRTAVQSKTFALNATSVSGGGAFDFSTGSATMRALDLSIDSMVEFNQGTKHGVFWNGTGLTLDSVGASHYGEFQTALPPWMDMSGLSFLEHFNQTTINTNTPAMATVPTNYLGYVMNGSTPTMTTPGKLGNAASFNAFRYVSYDSSAAFDLKKSDGFTLSFWISAPQVFSPLTLISRVQSNKGFYVSLLGSAGAGKIQLIHINGGAPDTVRSSFRIDDNKFHHVAFTASTSTFSVYVDGKLDVSSTAPSSDVNYLPVPLTIGANIDGSQPFDGKIDEVAFFKRAITAAEVSKIYRMQAPAKVGFYRSAVLDAGVPAAWTPLSWLPVIPYGKPLPGNQTESSFPLGNFNSQDISLYLPLDSNASNAIDSSGNASSIGLSGTGALPEQADAVMGNGFRYLASAQWTQISNGPHLNVTASNNLTIAAWIKADASNVDNVIVKKGAIPGSPGYSLTLDANGYLTFIIADSAHMLNISNSTDLRDGLWHHVVAVYAHDERRLRIYVDNDAFLGTATSDGQQPGDLTNSAPVQVGGLSGSGTMTLDDVLIARRAFTAADVSALYLRGTGRINLQVRSCNDATCNGSPFIGPDSTSNSFFNLAEDMSLTPPQRALTLANHRFIQFQAYLSNRTMTGEPELRDIKIGPARYPTDGRTLSSSEPVPYAKLTSFAAATAGSGAVYFQLTKDGIPFYHDGSTWRPATMPSHYNVASEINATIATFSSEIGTGSVGYKAIFKSNGTEIPSLSSVVIGYIAP